MASTGSILGLILESWQIVPIDRVRQLCEIIRKNSAAFIEFFGVAGGPTGFKGENWGIHRTAWYGDRRSPTPPIDWASPRYLPGCGTSGIEFCSPLIE
jgi:hypothetical protein